jgi:hypothetical protein
LDKCWTLNVCADKLSDFEDLGALLRNIINTTKGGNEK